MEILDRNGLRVLNLTDGMEHEEAIRMINSGYVDGINFNYIRNRATNLNFLSACPGIKYLQLNDSNCDYSIVNSLYKLESLDVYTNDKSEIQFDCLPRIKSVAIDWRPKAKSIFECSNLERLYLGKYTGKDLSAVCKLTKLKYLRINTGSIQTLKGIEYLEELEELWLMLIPSLKDLEGLQHLSKLRLLRIDNCKNIANINKIEQLPASTSIILAGTTKNLQ